MLWAANGGRDESRAIFGIERRARLPASIDIRCQPRDRFNFLCELPVLSQDRVLLRLPDKGPLHFHACNQVNIFQPSTARFKIMFDTAHNHQPS